MYFIPAQRIVLSLIKCIQPSVCRYARRISTSGRLSSEELVVHRDSSDNNPQVPFEFTEANMTRLEAIIKNYPTGCQRSAVGAALDLVQRQIGWIPISAMHKVAEILHMPRMRVYEWATFYTMCKRRYRGHYHVKVCKTTPCMLRGSDLILQAVEHACCCQAGELSPDYMFGVDTVECAGACVNAPIVVVNDDYYEDLTIDGVYNLINTLRCGSIPPMGPQSGRGAAEPITGLTSLLAPPQPPGYGLQKDLC
ncbi:thioredoxin-like [2Fe-2S] ferredoxin domain-containing protein [Phthorimaea operculella]|nr:thioredoxin-like [2Fe-2S] ferredoxin domain-containing protein [Phthorimaea operculella]